MKAYIYPYTNVPTEPTLRALAVINSDYIAYTPAPLRCHSLGGRPWPYSDNRPVDPSYALARFSECSTRSSEYRKYRYYLMAIFGTTKPDPEAVRASAHLYRSHLTSPDIPSLTIPTSNVCTEDALTPFNTWYIYAPVESPPIVCSTPSEVLIEYARTHMSTSIEGRPHFTLGRTVESITGIKRFSSLKEIMHIRYASTSSLVDGDIYISTSKDDRYPCRYVTVSYDRLNLHMSDRHLPDIICVDAFAHTITFALRVYYLRKEKTF